MMHYDKYQPAPLTARSANWLIHYLLPLGWLALATGMFWVGDRSLYHKVYYGLLVTPTVLLVVLSPRQTARMWSEPILQAFTPFALYIALTLAWSSDAEPSSLKYPLYVLMLFVALGHLVLTDARPLLLGTLLAALVAPLSALVTLGWWFHLGAMDRLTGYGALYNPLLTTHVFGFYAAMWLAVWCSKIKVPAFLPLTALAILMTLIVFTGSRTPLLALAACLLWLMLAAPNRRSLGSAGFALLIAALLLWLVPETILQRGASFRPAIWHEAWRQIQEAPWFGHGFGTPMVVRVSGLNEPLADPHNLTLGVLYQAGILGGILWLALYSVALYQAWVKRHAPLVLIAGTTVVFGLTAGMTEGSSFMSRPKEHWFLTWIPLGLLFAALLKERLTLIRDSRNEEPK
ncbi:O-antigen ligase family protein [Pseudomonas oryzihabitans]|uniref:O-antigen ligase family protein n=1 Tax=Pseudomonas oryzihabitans TaxID=47885 RepID=UPI002B1E8B18|nr:O-antigen ligase family protein [Pseudomonas oryzihabitans]